MRAVVADIKERAIGRIVCVGDVVGVGPEPAECVDLVREHCFILIRGDHDEAMLSGVSGFSHFMGQVLEWSKQQLETDPTRLQYLEKSLPSFESAGISFHHGSPRSKYEYLFASDVKSDPRKLRTAFHGFEKVCFHCHTHVPGLITQEPLQWRSAQELDNYYHYRKGEKILVNVGSVGQSRDGDTRACYLEINKNEIYWRRVDYDVAGVVAKVQANEVLAPAAPRLQKGR